VHTWRMRLKCSLHWLHETPDSLRTQYGRRPLEATQEESPGDAAGSGVQQHHGALLVLIAAAYGNVADFPTIH
jgi:hypothetical protein